LWSTPSRNVFTEFIPKARKSRRPDPLMRLENLVKSLANSAFHV
jgi:hypothetical protein